MASMPHSDSEGNRGGLVERLPAVFHLRDDIFVACAWHDLVWVRPVELWKPWGEGRKPEVVICFFPPLYDFMDLDGDLLLPSQF